MSNENPATQVRCRICGAHGSEHTLLAREMMFGTRKEFEYFQCESCGCLQIKDIPENLSQYYPDNYYSLNFKEPTLTPPDSAIRRVLTRWRIRSALFGRGFKLGRLASKVVDLPDLLRMHGKTLQKLGVQSFSDRFMDVGCGSNSAWLNDLMQLGFTSLAGIDPHIPADISEGCISIRRASLDAIEGKYDVVTLHHSLEHMPNQHAALSAVASSLTRRGRCLVRIPLVSSTVWNIYKEDWVELDAPRHLYLHSAKSLTSLANTVGLELVESYRDSTEFEFWGSEQYRRGIPLMARNSLLNGPDQSDFTLREVQEFRRMADKANKENLGGRGCFVFRLANKV